MHAFDYVVLLLSFVYAASITHVLATAGDLITAGRRVRISWSNLGWMVVAVFSILSWWLGTWELREVRTWGSLFIVFNFAMACALYVVVRLTCAQVPATGEVDLPAFHLAQGRKYLWATTLFATVAMGYNAAYDIASNGSYFLRQDIAVLPMMLASAVAAIYVRRPYVQAACLTVEFAAWGLYFMKFQHSLTG